MPVYHAIFTGLMLDGSSKWTVALNIMGAMGPQIAALAPLLIVVRIGLGQAIEENTSHLSRNLNGRQTGSINGNTYSTSFRATTTRNEELVGEVITIGHIGASDHDLRDNSKPNHDGY
ncbi:hypothetical protein V5O48_012519 [Marasmius crinis-equi]|uniref:Uncharacterized protein n=1 Tax=Marasmius crinis-equi TaxID=585013 RepID=A0ABR3F2W3_9AGAR